VNQRRAFWGGDGIHDVLYLKLDGVPVDRTLVGSFAAGQPGWIRMVRPIRWHAGLMEVELDENGEIAMSKLEGHVEAVLRVSE